MSGPAGKEKARRGYVTLKAVDPRDGREWDVLTSHEHLDVVAKRGLHHALECAYTVPAVLQQPTAIFEGLRADEDEDRIGYGWLCYVGQPRCAYNRDGTERPPWPEEVFLVFVNHDRVAYNWRWDKCDPSATELPVRWDERFAKRLL